MRLFIDFHKIIFQHSTPTESKVSSNDDTKISQQIIYMHYLPHLFLTKLLFDDSTWIDQFPYFRIQPKTIDANGPFAASGHMVHAGGQAAHWDIQNKATSSR